MEMVINIHQSVFRGLYKYTNVKKFPYRMENHKPCRIFTMAHLFPFGWAKDLLFARWARSSRHKIAICVGNLTTNNASPKASEQSSILFASFLTG
jgi:hypothetical protein